MTDGARDLAELAKTLEALGFTVYDGPRELQFKKTEYGKEIDIWTQEDEFIVDAMLSPSTWQALDAIRAWQSGSPAPRQDGVTLARKEQEALAADLRYWTNHWGGMTVESEAILERLEAAVLEAALGAKP